MEDRANIIACKSVCDILLLYIIMVIYFFKPLRDDSYNILEQFVMQITTGTDISLNILLKFRISLPTITNTGNAEQFSIFLPAYQLPLRV